MGGIRCAPGGRGPPGRGVCCGSSPAGLGDRSPAPDWSWIAGAELHVDRAAGAVVYRRRAIGPGSRVGRWRSIAGARLVLDRRRALGRGSRRGVWSTAGARWPSSGDPCLVLDRRRRGRTWADAASFGAQYRAGATASAGSAARVPTTMQKAQNRAPPAHFRSISIVGVLMCRNRAPAGGVWGLLHRCETGGGRRTRSARATAGAAGPTARFERPTARAARADSASRRRDPYLGRWRRQGGWRPSWAGGAGRTGGLRPAGRFEAGRAGWRPAWAGGPAGRAVEAGGAV